MMSSQFIKRFVDANNGLVSQTPYSGVSYDLFTWMHNCVLPLVLNQNFIWT